MSEVLLHFQWRCSVCGALHAPDSVRYTCPSCGDRGLLAMAPDYERIGARWTREDLERDPRRSIWRYTPLLPLIRALESVGGRSAAPGDRPAGHIFDSLLDAVGWTPIYAGNRLGADLGLSNLFVKDDGRNPTGSYKDRASALVVARAGELGESTIAVASTGNAAAATAGLTAAAGLRSVIFVPESAPEPKIAQLLIHGATVLLVRGTYDQAYDLCLAACARWGWYCRNTGYNPFTTEGKKTGAFEIVEQLGWRVPDAVVVAVGDGNILASLHRGFTDLVGLGWIPRLPRLIGVQAAKSPAIFNAWRNGVTDVSPSTADSLADSINASEPRDGRRALQAIRETGGGCLAVDDEAILEAMARVARRTGLFVEPAAGAAFAGLFALAERNDLARDERVVVVSTGTGLKDTRAAMRAAAVPSRVDPNVEAVAEALRLTPGSA